MAQDFVGPVVAASESRGVPLPEGALPLHCLGMEGPRSPDVAFSFAFDAECNEWGQVGYCKLQHECHLFFESQR